MCPNDLVGAEDDYLMLLLDDAIKTRRDSPRLMPAAIDSHIIFDFFVSESHNKVCKARMARKRVYPRVEMANLPGMNLFTVDRHVCMVTHVAEYGSTG